MTSPALLKIMNRVLLVPWSIDPTHWGAFVLVSDDAFIIASTSLRIKSSNVSTFKLSWSCMTLVVVLLLMMLLLVWLLWLAALDTVEDDAEDATEWGLGPLLLVVPWPLPPFPPDDLGDDRVFFFITFFPIVRCNEFNGHFRPLSLSISVEVLVSMQMYNRHTPSSSTEYVIDTTNRRSMFDVGRFCEYRQPDTVPSVNRPYHKRYSFWED